MTYEMLLLLKPSNQKHGDREAALGFVQALSTMMKGPDHLQLSRAQMNYLYRLLTKWQARADGKDIRWNVIGAKVGRPMTRVAVARKRFEAAQEDLDPLSARLLQKYGGETERKYS